MSDVAPPDSASPGREILPSGPAGTQGLASAGPVIQGLAVEALAYAEASDAPATRRAYNSAWRAFEAWCAQHGQQPMPASAGAVAMYLVAGARRLAVSSLMVHRAAIDEAHRALDHPRPDSAHLRKIWKGIRKTHGRPPAKKRALTAGDLRRALKATPATMAGARDRALILVGFASALRRSELAALTIGGGLVSAHFVSEGLEIVIAKSKGDQLGAGATVPIPHGRQSGTCPVRALQDWLSAAGIVDGPVYRAVDRLGRVGETAMADRTVARIVKAAAVRAGLDPRPFAGHSLRRGMISGAAIAGADREAIQAHARHARWDTTRGYIEAATRFGRHNAAGRLGL